MEQQTVNVKTRKSDKGSFVLGLIIGILITLLLTALVILGVLLFCKSDRVPHSSDGDKELEELLDDNELVDEQMLQKLSAIEEIIDEYYYKNAVTFD